MLLIKSLTQQISDTKQEHDFYFTLVFFTERQIATQMPCHSYGKGVHLSGTVGGCHTAVLCQNDAR